MSDSWFFTAQVRGQSTGKRYQLVAIFDRNYITAAHLNFYQVSVFDYETGYYNTFTEYDLPVVSLLDQKLAAIPGSLDVSFISAAGNASWHNLRNLDNSLSAFRYGLACPGRNHVDGTPFSFQLTADMQKSPVAVGASILRGIFTFYAERGTYSYFQPGPDISGSLPLGDVTERITGAAGHIDRQLFPAYSGIFTPTGRQHSHVWIQINLDSGVDLSIWRQFDRVANNSVIADSGVTVSFPPGLDDLQAPPLYQDGLQYNDMTIEYPAFEKYPRDAFSTLLPPPSSNMYLPSHVIVHSKKLDMTLEGKYTTPVPVAQLPIEYFEGPALWNGIFQSVTTSGIGILESTFALYRDWELAWVLRERIAHLPVDAFSTATPRETIVKLADGLQTLVSDDLALDQKTAARSYNDEKMRPALTTLIDVKAKEKMLMIDADFDSSLDLMLQF